VKFSPHGVAHESDRRRTHRGVPSEEAIRDRDRRGGKARPSRDREPSEARRAAIDQLCDRLACDFDETVLAIESILGVPSRTM
jgi:hypothetical protein